MNTLIIKRFNGDEVYEISSASIKEVTEQGDVYTLIKIKTGKVIATVEDTVMLKALPTAELHVTKPMSDILGVYDFVDSASFYYVEHTDVTNNRIQITGSVGEGYHLHWEGEIMDVNYYDGSKPNAHIVIDTDLF